MNRKITLFALAGKCGDLGASGEAPLLRAAKIGFSPNK